MLFKNKKLYILFFGFLLSGFIAVFGLEYITEKTTPWEIIKEHPLLFVLYAIIIFLISYFSIYFDKKGRKKKSKHSQD